MPSFTQPFAILAEAVTRFGRSNRYDYLFSLSDAELARRGLDRDGLVRGYIQGLAQG
ncbi:MAG: hypothetical protein QNJ44_18405 [Rhodobacter sp.]|nr:hypothetical protein [Rhodobacter sp.]